MNIGYRARCVCDETKDCVSKLQVYEWAERHAPECDELSEGDGIVVEEVLR